LTEFKNLNNNIVVEMRNILESLLISCSDIFAKMFIELQSYNSLCNRIFDANFFYDNSRKNNVPITNLDNNIVSFIKGKNFIDLDNINYKKVIKENTRVFNEKYFEVEEIGGNFNEPIPYSFNQIDLSTRDIANSESIYKFSKQLKPSENKFFYFLQYVLGMKDEDIIKIYTYLRIDPNQFSKNINIFENFNLYSFPIKRMLKLVYNNFNNSISFQNDISTLIYDFLFEEGILNSDAVNSLNFLFNNQGTTKLNINSFEGYNSLSPNEKVKFDSDFLNSLNLKCSNNFSFNQNELNTFQNNISLKDIFEYIITPSFSLNKNFYNFETGEDIENFKIMSGCENIIEDTNYLNFENNSVIIRNKRFNNNENLFRNILETYFRLYYFSPAINDSLSKKSVDLNHNWYNQIARSLILNDTITATNMEIIKYYNSYEKGLGFDSFKQYQYLQQNRTNAPGLNLTGLKENIFNSYNFLNENTPISNFKLKKNNFNLKKSYIKNFLQTKKIRNIFDDLNNGALLKNNTNKTIQNILNNNEKSLLLSNFKDFYLKKFNNKKVSNNEFTFLDNYSTSTQKKYILNQTKILNNCDILTVGIENNQINFENNDVVILTVEMIDHDYPDIIWEPKKFEFDMSLDDVEDEILQLNEMFRSKNEVIVDLNNFLNVPFVDYDLNISEEQLLKKLISESTQYDNENYTNNIGSLLNQKYVSVGINENISNIINKRKSILKEKFNKIKILNNSILNSLLLINILINKWKNNHL